MISMNISSDTLAGDAFFSGLPAATSCAEAPEDRSVALQVVLSFMQASPMPMLLWWGDEILPRAHNTGFERLLGQAAATMAPEAWSMTDWAQIHADMAQVRRSGQAVWRENLPVPLPNTPAGEFRGTYSYNPILDASGVAGVLFMCTRHYRASTVNMDGRFGYAAVIHSMDVGFAIVEAVDTPPGQLLDYRFIEVNGAWEKQTGFNPVPDKRVTDLLSQREPFWPSIVERVLRTGASERTTTHQGTWGRTVEVFAMRMGNGNSRQVALMVRDISAEAQAIVALQRSERRAHAEATRAEAERKRLDVVLETTPAPVYVVDAQGSFVLANSRARAEWGEYPSKGPEQWVGWWADGSARHGQPVQPHQWPLARALQGQSCQDLIEIAFPPDTSQRRICLISGAPLFDNKGAIEGAVITAADLTMQIQAERALQQANERKDEFLAMLAHELRNPLAPIGAAAELMGRPQAGKDLMVRTSAIIARQVRHMTGLIDDLLDMSRVSRGAITLDREFLDTCSVVNDALEQVNPLLRARRHRLEVTPPPQPLLFEGDRKRVIQVLSNLLNNAIKYTPEGGQIALVVEQVDEHLEFRVRDNGVGMNEATLAQAFEMFAQARRTSDRQQGGLGIGLALVKRLVELHGGRVSAKSAGPGRGSEFCVRFPTGQGGCGTSTAPSNTAAPTRPLRVMVVDDHVDGALTLSMLIEADGHQCQVTHEAMHALHHVALQAPNALVLDIGLPGMDGRELARRLRALPVTADALLIGLSGYAQPKDKQAALEAGFDHYLVKPVDSAQLLNLLAQHSAKLAQAAPTQTAADAQT